MIRLGHILTSWAEVGGTEQMVLNLCKFRDRKGFECLVSMPEEGVIAEEIRSTGVTVYTGQHSGRAVIQWANLINLHWSFYFPEWHNMLQSSGKPYVTALHWMTEMPDLPVITICTSPYVYEIQKDKSLFIPIFNGVDLSQFTPRPKRQKEEVIITRVCRLSRCALYFWSSMRKVLARYPQAKLWIVGNTEQPDQSMDRVEFLGIRRDIPDILADSDIFAYTPYPHEGAMDLVAMEASAMGVPCVVSDVRCVNYAVEEGQNGFLTPFGDVDAFAQRVGMLVEDADLRSRMGETAIRIARERFDMQSITRRYEDLYRKVLEYQ